MTARRDSTQKAALMAVNVGSNLGFKATIDALSGLCDEIVEVAVSGRAGDDVGRGTLRAVGVLKRGRFRTTFTLGTVALTGDWLVTGELELAPRRHVASSWVSDRELVIVLDTAVVAIERH